MNRSVLVGAVMSVTLGVVDAFFVRRFSVSFDEVLVAAGLNGMGVLSLRRR